MRAAFEPTWNRLTEDERSVFSKLSVFRGGFTREAAEQVAGATLRTLTALVDKSLLRIDANGRYDLHELLRQYASEKLAASDSIESTGEAYSAYYAAFLNDRVEDLKGRRQIEAIREVNADFENVRTAWNWAASHKRQNILSQMIDGVWLFCMLRSRESEQWTMLSYAEQQLTSERGREMQRLLGRLLARQNIRSEAFQAQCETALQIARHYEDIAEIAFCLFRLGTFATDQWDFSKARQLHEQSLAIYQQLQDRFMMAWVLFALMESSQKIWAEFRQFGEESLRLSREIGDRVGMAYSLFIAAHDAGREGRFDEAESLWLERIALGHEIGNRDLIAVSNAHLSYQVYFIRGDFAQARAAAEESLKIATSLGDSNDIGWALAALGLLASLVEQYQEGERLCRQASLEKGVSHITDTAIWGLSIAACGLGNYDAARDFLMTSLKTMIDNRGQTGIIACLPVAAIILAHWGNPIQAVEWLSLAFNHPVQAAGWMEKWPLLTRLRAELEQTLGSPVYSAAWARGKQLELNQAAAELWEWSRAGSTTRKSTASPSLEESLTSRELEILRLLAAGFSNPDIARKLIISVGTVKAHTSSIYGKLSVENRVQAVNEANKRGLL